MGIVAIVPDQGWGVRKSGGFEVMQIITTPGVSRLESRSQEYAQAPPKWAKPYWFLDPK